MSPKPVAVDANGIDRELAVISQSVGRTAEGARLFEILNEKCGLLRTPYQPGDPHHSAFLAGRHDVANWLNLHRRAVLKPEQPSTDDSDDAED